MKFHNLGHKTFETDFNNINHLTKGFHLHNKYNWKTNLKLTHDLGWNNVEFNSENNPAHWRVGFIDRGDHQWRREWKVMDWRFHSLEKVVKYELRKTNSFALKYIKL